MYEFDDNEKLNNGDESVFQNSGNIEYSDGLDLDDDTYGFDDDETDVFEDDSADVEEPDEGDFYDDEEESDEDYVGSVDDDEEYYEEDVDNESVEASQYAGGVANANSRSPYLNPQPKKSNNCCMGCLLVILLIILAIVAAYRFCQPQIEEFKAKFMDKVAEKGIEAVQNGDIKISEETLEDVVAKQGEDLFKEATESLSPEQKEKVLEEAKKAGVPEALVNNVVKNIEKKAAVETKPVQAPVKKEELKVATKKEELKNTEPKKTEVKKTASVKVSVTERAEPFYPLDFVADIKKNQNPDDFYIDAPVFVEADPIEKTKLSEMSKLTVSGIMFDKERPSAIIKYNNIDYLVHKGDNFEGFEIVDIQKTKVTVKNETNTFSATIGQEFASAPNSGNAKKVYTELTQLADPSLVPVSALQQKDLQFGNVSNLEKKFAGAYRPVSKESIIINGK